MRAQLPIIFALILAFTAALCLGRTTVTFSDLVQVLRQGDEAKVWFLIYDLRLPRLLTATGAGAAFGLAGAISQSLFRNPLAAPEMLGVTAGASLGAVAVLLTGANGIAVTTGAISGAIAATCILLVLTGRQPEVSRLILTGIGISLTATAMTSLLISRASDTMAGDAMLWLTGSLNGRHWPHAELIWSVSPFLLVAAAVGARSLDRMELGDDLAQSLGIRVQVARPLLILLIAALVAAGVAVTGPIGFVGLMAGPIARRLAGGSSPDLIGAAMIGALILLLADLIVTLTAPLALLPAGIFTGLMGAPWLIWLLWRGDTERRPG
ncbi:FecCD family ABC transporter permease [Paracoccus saliphilus]|uniref:Iron ABC transporter permease n=1 Tax=Paracoccus saliphilus TaxID=405559 RepID=A0AA46A6K1_9RHOB|nr:iron ABC transporter permease [Paracoccus saliphilus]WCR01524.1 iron ABC transporter permease [Paracoccus saliphilus]SIS99265.1 iron complex transport system permease protein [Paracoccus saliphilus]